MKKIIYLIACLLCIQVINAQQLRLDWAAPSTANYSQNNIELCGASRTLDLRVSHVQGGDSNCPYGGFGFNKYRYTMKIFRNNVLINTKMFRASSCWAHIPFYNINLTPGSYRAEIRLETRRFPWGWRTRFTRNTNVIQVTRNAAVPSFTINGVIPNPEVPIEVCSNDIIIDASSTTCEDKYWVGVWEFDYDNWNRPQEYEWGKWFNGQAPSNLNLQQLSANHSFGSSFLGNNTARQGEILYGGKLPNGNDRYYHVSVCTGFPAWKCSSAVIKVKCDCN